MMLLIIDGNNLAHRCKHTFSLTNKGIDVSVTYGVIRVLGSLMHKYKPTSVLVCWDGGVPEFRRQAVPSYKANRHQNEDPEEYEDFLRQMRELEDYALPMMGIVNVRKDGAEADDLMYHAAMMSVQPVVLVTTDKDMLQAVNDNVSVLNPTKDILYTPSKVFETYGVVVSQIIDWRALQGDSSDNVPGIPGIGEKTATKLFEEYLTLTQIVNAALGHHPTKRITGRVADGILSFGFERIAKNILVTALYADRVGARQAVLDAVRYFHPADKDRVKKYFMRMTFVSMLEGTFFSSIAKLGKPQFSKKDLRIPVVLGRTRKPYES